MTFGIIINAIISELKALWADERGFLKLFGSKSGSTTRQEMPEFQEKVVRKAFKQIVPEVLEKPWEFFPGQTYADFSPESELGLSGIAELAGGDNELLGAAGDVALSTLRGDYLDPMSNPFFGQLSDALTGQIGSRIMGNFSGAFRNGMSPGAMQQIGSGVTSALAPMLFNEYGNERSRQMGTMGMAGDLYGDQFSPYERLMGVGAMREGMEQQGIDEAMNRHQFAQAEAYNRLARTLGLAGNMGQYGGTTHQSGYQFGGSADFTGENLAKAMEAMGMGG